MAEDTGEERSEEPTGRRINQARDKGQVARSRELGTAAVLISSAVGLYLIGSEVALSLARVFERVFTLDKSQVFDNNALFNVWGVVSDEITIPMLKFMALIAVFAFAGNILLGGVNFSVQAMLPTANKMSPIAGFKRMFGVQALVELAKGLAKFSVVAIVAYQLLSFYFADLVLLSSDHLPGNVYRALELLAWMFILLCCSILFIVVIDVPFQIWNHNKQLKMTKQEVKDEYKDTEGKPEVKGRVRQVQRELAQRRMMAEVPNADVIIVNPEHYAVAIKYDVKVAVAPIVLAKGVDEVAFRIREIARAYNIAIVSAPPLSRAIYYTTKLEQQIPEGLFTAVAQILAYVFQLRQYQSGRGKKPTPIPLNQPIPEEFRF